MNRLTWAIAITISITGILLILNPLPNVVTAYSCSSSTSSQRTGSVSSGVSGPSGSCASSSSVSSSASVCCHPNVGGQAPNQRDAISPNFPFNPPGVAISLSGGGSQPSCVATSANNPSVGDGFDFQQGSCTTHHP